MRSVAAIVGKRLGQNDLNSWAIFYTETQELVFETGQGMTFDDVRVSAPLRINNWQLVTVRWDGTTKAVFLDGNRLVMRGASAPEFDGGDLVVGADIDFGDLKFPWPGALDELRIYNYALDDDEIAALTVRN